MKKMIAVLALALAVACFAAVGAAGSMGNGEKTEYLRIHIRANSNSEEDQSVKYKVRDAVVEFLTPTVAECPDKETAMEKIGEKLTAVAQVADSVLRANGYYYGARADIRQEEFPTRVYEGATLEAGAYDALIVELGTGKGDNWWCVVYPPLCFTAGGGNVVYKSKIAEIVRKFFG